MHPRLFALMGLAFAIACSHDLAPRATHATGPVVAAAPPQNPTVAAIRAALASADRPESDRARDIYRHPRETLAFFGLRDDMTVVELSPGAGWYTAVLAPVLKGRGQLVVAISDPAGPPDDPETKRAREYVELLQRRRQRFGEVRTVVLDPADGFTLGPPESADLVVTFRNLHDWIGAKYAVKMLAAAFQVLKPGGILGVEDHRAARGQDVRSGYVQQGLAKHLAEHVGFKLIAASEINANPKDTKDYPAGVWTLPPTLRLGAQDRDKYIAIGESDRFTLKFVKPTTDSSP